MCPFCFATMGLVVAGVASTGGLAALAVKVSRKKNAVGDIIEQFEKNGFHILAMKMLEISPHQAEHFFVYMLQRHVYVLHYF